MGRVEGAFVWLAAQTVPRWEVSCRYTHLPKS